MSENKKHIRDIQIGDKYKFLPTGEIFTFEKEDDIAWEVINPDNYSVIQSNKKEETK